MIVPLSVIGLKRWYINTEGGLGAVGSTMAQQSCTVHLLVFYHCIHNSQSVSAPLHDESYIAIPSSVTVVDLCKLRAWQDVLLITALAMLSTSYKWVFHMHSCIRIYCVKLIQLVNTLHHHPGAFHWLYWLQLHLVGFVRSRHVSGVYVYVCISVV